MDEDSSESCPIKDDDEYEAISDARYLAIVELMKQVQGLINFAPTDVIRICTDQISTSIEPYRFISQHWRKEDEA